MGITPKFVRKLGTKRTRLLGVVGVFIVIGIVSVFLARAATLRATVEAENGLTTGNAVVVNDGSRSGGGYVQFKQPTSGGVNKARPFAATSPWNTPTPTSTRWFDYPALHHCPNNPNCVEPGFVNFLYSTTWSTPTDPVWTFQLPAYSAPEWHRVRAAKTVQIRAPENLRLSDPGNDRLITVVDPVSGYYLETYHMAIDTAHHIVRPSGDGQEVWHDGNMITGSGVGNAGTNLGAGARASNFTWAAGQITQADIAAGKIDHALEVTLPQEMVLGGPGSYSCPNGPGPSILPATAGNGCWPTGKMPLGTKIGIPASTPKPANLNPIGSMVFDALQKYGAYVGDVGGQYQIMFAADWGSFGYPPTLTSLDTTVFDPLIGCWGHACTPDFPRIQPLLRVADYQP